jgi:hypothetical protein
MPDGAFPGAFPGSSCPSSPPPPVPARHARVRSVLPSALGPVPCKAAALDTRPRLKLSIARAYKPLTPPRRTLCTSLPFPQYFNPP